jgi:MFS family permease
MQSAKMPLTASPANVTLLLWSCVVAANFFNTDSSLVGMIAPTLITSLGASQSLVSLTSAIFTLMVAAFLLGGAALGDIHGRKRIMLIGIAGETVMAGLAWLTPNVTLLLPIRTAAGIFAALISPTALALVTVNFAAGPARTKAISLYVVAFGVIGSLASVLIQYLNQTFGWRVPFGLFVVWGLLALFMVMRFVTESKGAGQRRMDWIGTGLAAVGLFLLLFGINNAGARGFTSPDVLVPALVGIVVLGVLVFYSSRIAQPVLQVKLFKSTIFAFGLLLGVMLNISYSASAYQANLLMQAVVKVPPVLAAIYLLPLAGGYLLAAPLPARLQGRRPTSLLLLIGTAILVAGTLLFGFMSAPQINFLTYLVPGLLLGLGMGLALTFKTTAVLSEAPPELAGAASATNNVSNNLGASLAVALSSALMGSFVITTYHALLEKAGLQAGQIATALGAVSQALSKTAATMANEFGVPLQTVLNLDALATKAYVQGLSATLLIIGAATLVVAVAVFFILRHKETRTPAAVIPPAAAKQSVPVPTTR